MPALIHLIRAYGLSCMDHLLIGMLIFLVVYVDLLLNIFPTIPILSLKFTILYVNSSAQVPDVFNRLFSHGM